MRFLTRSGSDAFIYRLVHSKSNQAGLDRPDNHKPIQAWRRRP
jgi:hypothetical protein